MNYHATRIHPSLRRSFVLSLGLLICSIPAAVFGQRAIEPTAGLVEKAVISLDPATGSQINRHVVSEARPAFGDSAPQTPANFHTFEDARLGELADLERLTLRFSGTTRLTKISRTADFRVEQGSSCVEGNVYDAGQTCTLLVRFTPQGAGNRLGNITIAHTASATPLFLGLNGYGYAPVLSFVPAVMTTIPTSFPASKGLLTSALNLSIDGGDTLYVADTGNNVIRSMDSSGNFTTVSSGTLSAPEGVVADTFGELYFTEPAQNGLFEIYAYGPLFTLSGSTASTCTTAAPCNISGSKVYTPGEMATDGYGRIFFVDGDAGAAEFLAQSTSASYAHLYDPFTYQAATPGVLAVDSSDNLYSFWYNGAVCSISFQSFYNASNSYSVYQKVAGGKTCGFAGDGGQARNAEISSNIGQMAFDTAGDLYFTDTGNQRVRRIDYLTGNINTIAGTGVAAYGGDNGQANQGQLANPSGVAVDSLGQVYVISATSSTGTTQVIRKIGADGMLNFGGQLKNAASAARTVALTNTGNSALTFTRAQITGPSAAEYGIDPNTTTCILTAGAQLNSGQTCYVGVIFRPAAAGTRTATLQFLDNTVPGTNNVRLTGGGTLPTATFAITSPASGASFTSGTTVAFTVTVTSSTSPAPTGTVKFTVDGAAYGNLVTVGSNGVASINLTGLTTANHTLAAGYSGDANYAASTLTRTITITAAATKAASTVVLTPSLNPATTCAAPTFSVKVTGADKITPSGTIQLKAGGAVIATATLANGVATLPAAGLSAGAHDLVASYGGDAKHAAANSQPVAETIAARPCASPVRVRTPLVAVVPYQR